MSVAIIGVGAMACLFASYLAPNFKVMMLGHWPEQLAALRQHGLTLETLDGYTVRRSVFATNDPSKIPPVDIVLVLVKSYQTPQAAQLAKKILTSAGLALTLQNGLGNLEQLTAVLGSNRAALGVTAHGATMLKPGRVYHAGTGPTHLAYSKEPVERIHVIREIFEIAGLQTDLADNVDSLVWGKLAINAGINPLTALLRVPNGFLAKNEMAKRVMLAAARETAVVAQALGIALPYPEAGQRTLEVAQATAANRSSMLQDILRGAPTEIEAICGAVAENDRRARIPTPINEKLLQLVKDLKKTDQRWMIEDLSRHFNP